MQSQISTGRQNYRQILTEMDMELRNLFVPSKTFNGFLCMTSLETRRLNLHQISHILVSWTCLKCFRYVEKRWASKGGLQPASKSAEIIFNWNESPAAGAKSATQRNRRLSLEESILVKHVAQIRPPVTRYHEVFMFNVKFKPW